MSAAGLIERIVASKNDAARDAGHVETSELGVRYDALFSFVAISYIPAAHVGDIDTAERWEAEIHDKRIRATATGRGATLDAALASLSDVVHQAYALEYIARRQRCAMFCADVAPLDRRDETSVAVNAAPRIASADASRTIPCPPPASCAPLGDDSARAEVA